MKKTVLFILLIMGVFVSSAFADDEKEINKTFDAKANLYVKLVSSDCDIEKGAANKIVVKVVYTYDDDCYEINFIESDEGLEIDEDFHGMCKGKSHMHIQVPEAIFVKFNSASGDFSLNGTGKGAKVNVASGDITIKNIVGDLELNAASGDMVVTSVNGNLSMNAASGDLDISDISGMTEAETASGDMNFVNIGNGLDVSAASGDVYGKNISGEFEIKTASGDIEIKILNGNGEIKAASGDVAVEDGKGAFEIKTASGNIDGENIVFTGSSELHAASGHVNVTLNATPDHDLEISSASGDAILDFDGNAIKGYVEMSAREKKGKIESDIPFDKEEKEQRHGKTYDVKWFTKGGDTPTIYIKTSTGTAKLIK